MLDLTLHSPSVWVFIFVRIAGRRAGEEGKEEERGMEEERKYQEEGEKESWRMWRE